MALDVRELLRRVRAGETDRAVSRALSVARKTVARYREWAGREGFLKGPLPTDLDLDLKLRGMVPECPLPRQPYKAAEFHGQIDGWLKAGVSPRAMFDRLKEDAKFTGSLKLGTASYQRRKRKRSSGKQLRSCSRREIGGVYSSVLPRSPRVN